MMNKINTADMLTFRKRRAAILVFISKILSNERVKNGGHLRLLTQCYLHRDRYPIDHFHLDTSTKTATTIDSRVETLSRRDDRSPPLIEKSSQVSNFTIGLTASGYDLFDNSEIETSSVIGISVTMEEHNLSPKDIYVLLTIAKGNGPSLTDIISESNMLSVTNVKTSLKKLKPYISSNRLNVLGGRTEEECYTLNSYGWTTVRKIVDNRG